jgi:NAD-dependent dihydropyrimidine dehydrogenase PreA subunit
MTDIHVTVDEKSCVGCSLCADVCPTDVFEWSDTEEKISISKEKECFGCLSCSEICPATAISHTDLPLSASYYHDRYALELTAKMGKPSRQLYVPDDDQMITDAMRDLGVRLLSVASVLKQTLGSSLPSVGTMAGMSLAAQLPRYQPVSSMEEACAWITRTFAPAWELDFSIDNNVLSLTVNKCFIRALCQQESIPLGGDLCILFYNYLAGYFAKVAKKRPRLMESVPGEQQCAYSVKLYG